MTVRVVNQLKIPENQTVKNVHSNYIARVANPVGRGIYYWQDWARFHHVLQNLPKSRSVLDVGVFTGQFFDSLSLSGKFQHVTGIDIVRKPGFHSMQAAPDIYWMNVAQMDFADNKYDTVVCMEVIEHLPEVEYGPALSELRRVCRNLLLISVPFNERQPISANHFRRFTPEDILREFPDAEYTLFYDPMQEIFIWAMIQEKQVKSRSLIDFAKGLLRSKSSVRKILQKAVEDPVGLAKANGIA